MRRVFAGAVLVVAAIAGLIEAGSHRAHSGVEYTPAGLGGGLGESTPMIRTFATHPGLSPTLYDLARIAGWALLVLGVIIAISGLIRYSRSQSAPASQ